MDDAKLRGYLLGELSVPDAVRMEERVLEEEQIFIALRNVEADLFDEYARNHLTALERLRFVERYGAHTARLAFARALAERSRAGLVGPVGPVGDYADSLHLRHLLPALRARPARPAFGLAAAAVLVLAIGVTVMRRDEAPLETPAARQPETRVAAVGTMVSLTLGTERAAGRALAVTLPQGSPSLELRVRLDPADRFDRYSMELRSASDNIVWGNKELRASVEGGELTLVAVVPAPVLDTGSYELGVRGGNPGAQLEDLGFMTLEIRRTP